MNTDTTNFGKSGPTPNPQNKEKDTFATTGPLNPDLDILRNYLNNNNSSNLLDLEFIEKFINSVFDIIFSLQLEFNNLVEYYKKFKARKNNLIYKTIRILRLKSVFNKRNTNFTLNKIKSIYQQLYDSAKSILDRVEEVKLLLHLIDDSLKNKDKFKKLKIPDDLYEHFVISIDAAFKRLYPLYFDIIDFMRILESEMIRDLSLSNQKDKVKENSKSRKLFSRFKFIILLLPFILLIVLVCCIVVMGLTLVSKISENIPFVSIDLIMQNIKNLF